jgi:hypothetical protein
MTAHGGRKTDDPTGNVSRRANRRGFRAGMEQQMAWLRQIARKATQPNQHAL